MMAEHDDFEIDLAPPRWLRPAIWLSIPVTVLAFGMAAFSMLSLPALRDGRAAAEPPGAVASATMAAAGAAGPAAIRAPAQPAAAQGAAAQLAAARIEAAGVITPEDADLARLRAAAAAEEARVVALMETARDLVASRAEMIGLADAGGLEPAIQESGRVAAAPGGDEPRLADAPAGMPPGPAPADEPSLPELSKPLALAAVEGGQAAVPAPPGGGAPRLADAPAGMPPGPVPADEPSLPELSKPLALAAVEGGQAAVPAPPSVAPRLTVVAVAPALPSPPLGRAELPGVAGAPESTLPGFGLPQPPPVEVAPAALPRAASPMAEGRGPPAARPRDAEARPARAQAPRAPALAVATARPPAREPARAGIAGRQPGDPRCGPLLARLQLGERPTDAERSLLQSACAPRS